jgi:Peroxisomal biogenesis factor 11 (PEX11)
MVLTRTISDIALILYFFTDHPLYFNGIGLKAYDKKWIDNLDYINNIFWLINSVLDIVVTLVDMNAL